jgi:Gpi18-like mannosyltransferase
MLVEEIYGDLHEREAEGTPNRPAERRVSPRAWLVARVDSAALAATMQAFTVSRIVLVAVTYLAMALHPEIWGHDHPSSKSFWDAWYQWDARWYVRVARAGYHWHDFHHWASVAFFPFYPILILILVTVLPVSTKLVAIIISNALFFAALYALFRLVRREVNGEIAGRTVFYLSVFPTALFFFAGYSESPFLLWSILSIAAMRQRRWAWAGIWGCLAAATRSQGLVLAVPFLVEWWAAYGPRRYTLVDQVGTARKLLITGLRWRDLAQVLWLGLIPAGWILLALYMQGRFSNPFLFIQEQAAWHRTTAWPWEGLWLSLQHISWQHMATPTSAHNLIELLTVLLFTALIALGWRQLPRSFSLYAIVSLLLILATPASLDNYYLPLMSTSRLCLAIFPCFVTLAIRGSWEPLDRLVTTLGPALLAIFTVVFLQGAWVA